MLWGYTALLASPATAEIEHELDVYYSNISWTKGFQNQSIPEVKNLKELDIYKQILQDSLSPDFVLLEASINPLPILGVYIRESQPSLYQNGSSTGFDGNLVESLTAGFEEPYALSLFVGRVLKFAAPKGVKSIGDNKGYIGYLLSVGGHHIQQNRLIRDNWLELEWKIKGKRETDMQYLSWSFRGGAKFHSHPEISDTFKLGLRRDRIDFQKAEDDFMRDIGIDYQLDVLQATLKPSKQTLIIDKHWPLNQGKLTMTLGFGVIWQGEQRYLGSLAKTQEKWTLVFRPNIKF
ncbi:MAG TPA: hypothetical protein EYG66_00105 [Mariprofundaceae bacterium]|nr:hypothetical protein [Mariprofundaceae bacterium]